MGLCFRFVKGFGGVTSPSSTPLAQHDPGKEIKGAPLNFAGLKGLFSLCAASGNSIKLDSPELEGARADIMLFCFRPGWGASYLD